MKEWTCCHRVSIAFDRDAGMGCSYPTAVLYEPFVEPGIGLCQAVRHLQQKSFNPVPSNSYYPVIWISKVGYKISKI